MPVQWAAGPIVMWSCGPVSGLCLCLWGELGLELDERDEAADRQTGRQKDRQKDRQIDR